jgi:hypothetical protein
VTVRTAAVGRLKKSGPVNITSNYNFCLFANYKNKSGFVDRRRSTLRLW